MKRKVRLIIIALLLLGGGTYYVLKNRAHDIVITGIVTTDDVIVSSEIQGRLQELLVREGDTVKRGQLLALIQPKEWKADMTYYQSQEVQTSNQISQAEANLASAKAQVIQAQADLENDRLNFQRIDDLYKKGVESAQSADQARTTYVGTQARVDSLDKQVEAAEAAVQASHAQLAAMGAQTDKAQVRLGYTEIHAPIDGIVDVRAALKGEVVSPGQGIVTLVDPDDFWVRADVEETYIDRFPIGSKLKVTLPSSAVREGTVFYRGVDADYATQRDVNRSKRDIKTFEIRLRCDNSDRALALGMTAYVTLPLAKQ